MKTRNVGLRIITATFICRSSSSKCTEWRLMSALPPWDWARPRDRVCGQYRPSERPTIAFAQAAVGRLPRHSLIYRCSTADGQTIFFKIDYFDRELSMHSPDPADPSVTQRVITIMLAEEY